MIDDEQFWASVYISVLAMRYHPKNDESRIHSHELARDAAVEALRELIRHRIAMGGAPLST